MASSTLVMCNVLTSGLTSCHSPWKLLQPHRLPPHWHDLLPQGLRGYCSLGLQCFPPDAGMALPPTPNSSKTSAQTSLSLPPLHSLSPPCLSFPLAFTTNWESMYLLVCLFTVCSPAQLQSLEGGDSVLFTDTGPRVVGGCSKNVLEPNWCDPGQDTCPGGPSKPMRVVQEAAN